MNTFASHANVCQREILAEKQDNNHMDQVTHSFDDRICFISQPPLSLLSDAMMKGTTGIGVEVIHGLSTMGLHPRNRSSYRHY